MSDSPKNDDTHDGPDFDWTPSLTACICSYYLTGTVRIPDACRGNDVLLALEYFGIVYAPDQLAFDSFGCYLRVKLWSDYYTHRAAAADWVVRRLMEGRSRHSHSFVTSPERDEAVYVGSKRCDVLDGGLVMPPGETGRAPKSCTVIHEFFNDDDDDRTPQTTATQTADASTIASEEQDRDDVPIDALLRDDFCAYVQSSLPGTLVTFRPREVSLGGGTGLTTARVTRAVLRIDFDARAGRKALRNKIRSSKSSKTGGKERSVVVVKKDPNGAASIVSALDDEVEFQSHATEQQSVSSKKSSKSLKIAVARATALATLDERDEDAATSNGLEINPALPVRHIEGAVYGSASTAGMGVGGDAKSMISALSSPFGKDGNATVVTPRGNGAIPETPEPAAAADPVAKKHLGRWVVEEESRPMTDLGEMARSFLQGAEGLVPGAGDVDVTQREARGVAAERGLEPTASEGNGGGVVEVFQSFATSVTNLMGVGAEEEKKEPFFEYFEPKEKEASSPGRASATTAEAGAGAGAEKVSLKKPDPPLSTASVVSGITQEEYAAAAATSAAGAACSPQNAEEDYLRAQPQPSQAQQQQQQQQRAAPQAQGKDEYHDAEWYEVPACKTLEDVNAEWLRGFFTAPVIAGMSYLGLADAAADGIPETPETCAAVNAAITRAATMGENERSDASVLGIAVSADGTPPLAPRDKASEAVTPLTPSTSASTAPGSVSSPEDAVEEGGRLLPPSPSSPKTVPEPRFLEGDLDAARDRAASLLDMTMSTANTVEIAPPPPPSDLPPLLQPEPELPVPSAAATTTSSSSSDSGHSSQPHGGVGAGKGIISGGTVKTERGKGKSSSKKKGRIRSKKMGFFRSGSKNKTSSKEIDVFN
uniref:Uncharacterized protein n=1 Tax=Odontella aurita TaxID=265563 RepID=A0A7S4K402_9STRA